MMFEKYDAYKDSELPSFGSVPIHWEIVPLCSITTLKSITNVVNEELLSVYLDKGVIRFDDVTEKRTNVTSLDLSKYQLVEEGDFVLNNQQAWRGSVGVSIYRGIVSPAYLVLKLSPKVDAKFANYFFRNSAMVSQYLINSKGVGTIQRNLYWQHLKRSDVVLPPREEQIEIAEFLNQKTAEIDQAIATKEKQIDLLNERKQIVIQKAVTQGLEPNVTMKDSGLNGVGNIPQDWEIIKFKYLAKVRYGLGQPPRQLDNGLKIIRATNIERGKIVEKGMLYIDPNDIPWDRNPTLNKDEIIVVRSGAYTGDSAIVTEEYAGCIAGYDMVATPFNCYPKFLSTVLLSHYVLYEQIYLLRMRSAQPHLNAEELNELKIVVPPINQQRLIANYIEKVESDIGEAISLIKQQLEKLKEYKTTLINDAVTGKIKVA
ncbi:restriction endonuclease subunit S [Acinetobacter ursingii]|uniref:restriction endonuclease subunit S n=2 Tax=Acinetobacter ursingii TaxID=108980 RepID=UPI00244AC431|nr:restriction endonuclease subunit S [Acinetobacter ursingii]MDH0807427.1 restriction endonuclease subunit S [Acinetobacter ursingii]MDH2074469.1 restriction endonuclease subunit S [Acinetobacter ursingii]